MNKSSKSLDADDCRFLGDRRHEEAARETRGRLAAAAAAATGTDALVSSYVSLMEIYCNHSWPSDAARKIAPCNLIDLQADG